MSKANLYQQRPADGIQAESPLHHAELDKLAARKVAKDFPKTAFLMGSSVLPR